MKLTLYRRPIFSVKRFLLALSFIIITIFSSNCTQKTTTDVPNVVADIQIVPTPVKILYKRGHFKIDKNTRVLLNLSDNGSKKMGKYLIDQIFEKTNYKLKIADRFTTNKINSGIEITIGKFKEIKPEGFKVVISKNRIKILANDQNGFHYAADLIVDLVNKNQEGWTAAQVSIEDYPETSTRAVYISLKDSIHNKSELLQTLIKCRINYVITDQKWEASEESVLEILDTESLPKYIDEYGVINTTINALYMKAHHSDSIIFNITNISRLHKDSLAVLGEAMWTTSGKRDYEQLINHLQARQKNRP